MIEFKIDKAEYKIKTLTIKDYYRIQNLLAMNNTNSKIIIVYELSGCPIEDLLKLEKSYFMSIWDSLVETELRFENNTDFHVSFEFEGNPYSFLEMSTMTIGEFADMEVIKASSDANKNIHTMMAIMYRPSIKVRGKLVAEAYDSESVKDRAELFLNLPMSYVFGALNFFLQVPNYLLKTTLDSLNILKLKGKEKKISNITKELTSELQETGITSLSSLPEKIRPKLMKLLSLAQSLSLTTLPIEKTKNEKKKKLFANTIFKTNLN